MDKPTKKKTEMYDYHEMVEYIEKKYNIHTRDYAGKFVNDKPDAPYLDFWHWLLDYSCGEIHNGGISFIPTYMAKDEQADKKWVTEILTMFETEFGDGSGEIECWIEW